MNKQGIINLSKEFYKKLNDFYVLSISENVALCKRKEDDGFCIVEMVEDNLIFNDFDRNTANLIYKDYINQLVYKEKANLDLMKRILENEM